MLGLGVDHTVIDMGAGTGAFVLHAAGRCKKVYAVDVSQAMLDYSRQKAEDAGLKNIVFCHGGFLTYEHRAEPADAMVSVVVLHHLPDFWKLVGLKRAADMLKPGGRFFLFDIVFPSTTVTDYEPCFNHWVQSIAEKAGPDFASEVETHIREEYSTYDWIMEEFLQRAGFWVDSAEYADGFNATYICTKRSS
jgi:ubiquinone/menaquinone biosynthesis C-methylase UbiE